MREISITSLLAMFLAVFSINAYSQVPSNFLFPHIAYGGSWTTTFTYVNQTDQIVSCATLFWTNDTTSGGKMSAKIPIDENGGAFQYRISIHDDIPPKGTVRRQTTLLPNDKVSVGWADGSCSAPIKMSVLFRNHDSKGVPTGEASVTAVTAPATNFVTYADQLTGIAYVGEGNITITARDMDGAMIATKKISALSEQHGSVNVGPFLGIQNFKGSVTITATNPIYCLSLNAEAYPVFSSLPPGAY